MTTAPTRTSIRAQAVSRLTAQVAAVSGRVYSSRSLPLPGDASDGGAPVMPCLQVYADRQTRDARADDAFDVTATLVVVVRVERQTEAQVETDLDTLSAEVETALLTDATLTGAVTAILRGEIARQVDGSAERIAGADVHQYQVRWTEFV